MDLEKSSLCEASLWPQKQQPFMGQIKLSEIYVTKGTDESKQQGKDQKKTCAELGHQLVNQLDKQFCKSKKIKKLKKKEILIKLNLKAINKIKELNIELEKRLGLSYCTQEVAVEMETIKFLSQKKKAEEFICYNEQKVLESSIANRSLLKKRLVDNDVESEDEQVQISAMYMRSQVMGVVNNKLTQRLQF